MFCQSLSTFPVPHSYHIWVLAWNACVTILLLISPSIFTRVMAFHKQFHRLHHHSRLMLWMRWLALLSSSWHVLPLMWYLFSDLWISSCSTLISLTCGLSFFRYVIRSVLFNNSRVCILRLSISFIADPLHLAFFSSHLDGSYDIESVWSVVR